MRSISFCSACQVGVAIDAILLQGGRQIDLVDGTGRFRCSCLFGGGYSLSIKRILQQSIFLVAFSSEGEFDGILSLSLKGLAALEVWDRYSVSSWMRWSMGSVARKTARNSSGLALK